MQGEGGKKKGRWGLMVLGKKGKERIYLLNNDYV